MLFPMLAGVMLLVPIDAEDARLDKRRTFVSEEARVDLTDANGAPVLCLDRARAGSICLTESQWNTAIALAEQQPRERAGQANLALGYRIPDTSSFGLASSPSTFVQR
ncbi:MAG: hypothetical protein NWP98_08545 [Erythrobacter sp.]|nr:hypothetical protein [Erythrobacter sp.]